jgi:hypothetical protein
MGIEGVIGGGDFHKPVWHNLNFFDNSIWQISYNKYENTCIIMFLMHDKNAVTNEGWWTKSVNQLDKYFKSNKLLENITIQEVYSYHRLEFKVTKDQLAYLKLRLFGNIK